jgi:hypothetical protein
VNITARAQGNARLGKLCASCFDVEAEKAKVRYSFVNVSAQSWNEQPPPRNRASGSDD